MKNIFTNRLLSLVLCMAMVFSMLPITNASAESASAPGSISTVADPGTLTRPETIYGNNTQNAGKITVGKSVATSDEVVELDGQRFQAADNNFLVTISQAAQVMGLSSETSAPVDVVFVLDTSGSMGNEGQDRVTPMVEAANSAIATLMSSNPNNRVGVVAFSSQDYGGGTGDGDAASVLSSLKHYAGGAATAHIQMVDDQGTVDEYGEYIAGRDTDTIRVGNGFGQQTRTVNCFRNGSDGGTNIQAGIALGAQMLMDVAESDTYIVNENGQRVTRMPFIIVLSDGAPTFSSSNEAWYNPSMSAEQGPGSSSYAGNGFLAAMTAAYYKGAITEHYYGSNASEDNRCNIYSLGVLLDSLDDDDKALAQITMDPSATLSATSNSYRSTFNSYWNSYTAGSAFNVLVNQIWHNGNWFQQGYWEDVNYTVTASSITATKNYVNGISSDGNAMYSGGLAYNDGYYNASNTSEIAGIFSKVMQEISKKAISSPTHVDAAHGEDFSGYVTFTDVLGEYMEVTDMKGIVADGNLYRGASFARLLKTYGKSNTDEQKEFDALLKKVLETRMVLTGSTGFDIDDFVADALASDHQVYWESNTDFDNSICWWGNAVTDSKGDMTVQWLGSADDDSIGYITNTTDTPAGANVVCRSYFFYGTAGNTAANPNHEYLYFVIRVQRSLTAPYQQTVVISAPASLLSVDEVLITESTDNNGNKTYTASVNDVAPARVVYEVGLREDINAGNVESIVSDSYKNEAVNGAGSANYDPITGAYTFFTNDWDRAESPDSHHRALTKATFNAAADNSFYTYQEDTLLYADANGTVYTGSQPSGTLYYARDVYSWSGRPNANGEYTATKRVVYIPVSLTGSESSTGIKNIDGKWYIAKGLYTASTLVVNGDDTLKDDPATQAQNDGNFTGTSSIVSHPHRTGEATDSHYTVFLGNNGKLTIVPENLKTVSIEKPGAPPITDGNGKVVMIGDTLNYTIKVYNSEDSEAQVTVTDKVPAGTSFVSADKGGTLLGDTVSWNLTMDAGETEYVSFKALVTQAALDLGIVSINNTATIQLNNDPAYETNTTTNPPEGKKVTNFDGSAITGNVHVGQVISYSILFHNDLTTASTVTITDKIPEGTAYIAGSADHDGVYDERSNTITWTLENVLPGTNGMVSFDVTVTADAITPESAGDTTDDIINSASIKVGSNDPRVTNKTTTLRDKGNLVLTKNVTTTGGQPNSNATFTLQLRESTGTLNGTFALVPASGAASTVTFNAGVANVTIRSGEELTIQGLPSGSVIYVTEADASGYTPSIAVRDNGSFANLPAAADVTAAAIVPVNSAVTVTVTNAYEPAPANFQLKGTKTFSGDNFPNGTFTFRAQACNDQGVIFTGSDAISVTATATYNGTAREVNFAFSNRSFTAADIGTRYYLIGEDASSLTGVTTDTTKYLLKLVISDNGEGQIVVDAQLAQLGQTLADFDWVNDTVDFTNSYKPQQTQLRLEGTKTLTGRYLDANEFSFELLDNRGNTVSSARLNVSDETSYQGTFAFDPITYTEEGTHSYIIREIDNALDRVTYDPSYYRVVVTVDDEGGVLKATPAITKYTYDDATGNYTAAGTATTVSFANRFTSRGTSVSLQANKTLSGKAAAGLGAGDFTFSIYRSDASGSIPVNATPYITGANAEDMNASGGYVGSINFPPFAYTVADMTEGSTILASRDFYYVVKENIPIESAPTFNENMFYDPAQYLVKVAVTYNHDTGEMHAVIADIDKKTDSGWANASAVAFENFLNPDTVSVSLEGTKNTTGTALPADLSFSFRVEDASGNLAGTGTSAPTEAGNGANKTITFSDLVFGYDDWKANQVGGIATFTYYIKESNATVANNGVDYDDTVFRAVVTVKRSDTYELVATVTYQNADGSALTGLPTFNNTYEAETHINLTASKVLTGRDLRANEFDFRLQRLNRNGNLVPGSAINGSNTAGKDGATAAVTFATLNYSSTMLDEAVKVGDDYYFSYLMSEIVPTGVEIPGVTYDPNLYVVTVKLTQTTSGSGSVLSAKLAGVSKAVVSGTTYTPGDAVPGFTENGATAVTFRNSYAVAHGTSATITAKKHLSGRPLKANEFSFELYIINADGSERLVAGASNAQNGDIIFNRTYPATMDSSYFDGNKATLKYHLKEVDGGLGGITYSQSEYWVKVEITKNDTTASLEPPVVTYYSNPEITTLATEVAFRNSYATGSTSYTPAANKILNGRDMTAREFRFEIVELDPDNGYAPIRIQLDGITTDKVVSTGSNAAAVDGTSAAITFSPIGYTDVNNHGTGDHYHYYAIREITGSTVGVTYDTTRFYLKVCVNDDGNGNLTVKSAEYYADLFTGQPLSGSSAVVFRNHYGPGVTTVNLALNKGFKTAVSGRPYDYILHGSEFDFNVYDYSGGVKGELVTTGTNGASVNGIAPITFGTLVYTREDVYGAGNVSTTPKTTVFQYIIEEVVPRNAAERGIVIDPNPIVVTVRISDDGYGNLTPDVSYRTTGGAAVTQFTNTYDPNPATLVIPLEKLLQGKDMTANDVFTFILKEGGTEVSRITNDSNGKAAFTLTFEPEDMEGGTKVSGVFTKVITYTLEESTVMPTSSNGSYRRDESTYTITVTLTDDGSGKLKASAAYGKNGDPVELIQFTNTYTPKELTEDLSAAIDGIKTVVDPEGTVLTDKRAGFKFNVTDLLGNVISTGVSGTDGSITFDPFTFTVHGEYHYRITEDATNPLTGYTYDGRAWEVQILVSYDAASGKLYIADGDVVCAPVAPTAGTSASPDFVNVYEPLPTDIVITAKKTLEGRDLIDGEFAFYLMENGIIKAVAHNDANGAITFPVTFTEPGDYSFSIKEHRPEGELFGVEYDETEYVIVTVKVVDDNGQLLATVSDTPTTSIPTGVEFVNAYTPAKTSAAIKAFKTLSGRQMAADEFTFLLTDETGKLIRTATNASDGTIAFEPIEYTQEDMDGETTKVFTYTLTEQIGSLKGISYDESSYTVTVTVTDDLLGQLHATVAHDTELVFRNTYEEIALKDVFLASEPTVSIDGKAVTAGEKLQYSITYKNVTNEDVTVSITDSIPSFTSYVEGSASNGGTLEGAKLVWKDLTVAKKSSVTVSFQVTVNGSGVAIVNGASVLVGNNTYETNLVTNFVPGKTADKTQAGTGEVLTYTVTYTNTTGSAAEVIITDTLDANLIYVDGSASHSGTYADGKLTWSFQNVAAGETVKVSFQANVKANANVQSVHNTAEVIVNGVSIKTNGVTTEVLKPGLTVSKAQAVGKGELSDKALNVEGGNKVTYAITVSNTGAYTAYGVAISDTIPSGLTYLDGTVSGGGKVENGVVSWYVESLAPGASVTVTFQVTVPTTKEVTQWKNIATATFDNDPNGGQPHTSNEVVITETPAATPDTGDHTQLGMLLGVMLLSGAAFVTMILGKKKFF